MNTILKNQRLTDADKLRALPWSIAANAFNQVFCVLTVFGSIFLLFLKELGLSKQLIGFLLALFPFCGLIAPFLSPYIEYFGSKRIFLLSFFLRKFFILLLIILPYITSHYGGRAALYFLFACISVFSIFRATAEAASFVWMKEYIPDDMRGKYSAINGAVVGIVGLTSVYLASLIVERGEGIERYLFLIGIGCIFGLIATFCWRFVSGGERAVGRERPVINLSEIIEPLKDRNFRFFLGAVGIALYGSLMMVFLPLFATEKIGIAPGRVVLFDNATIAGSLLFGFLWGWISDRFGGRPLLMISLSIYAGVMLTWIFFPRESPSVFLLIAVLYFVSGSTITGRTVGDTRFLYSAVVPDEGTVYYTSLHYASVGLVSGLAPISAGYILHKFVELDIKFKETTIDSYTVIFVLNFLCQLIAMYLYRKIEPDKRIKTRHLLMRITRWAMAG